MKQCSTRSVHRYSIQFTAYICILCTVVCGAPDIVLYTRPLHSRHTHEIHIYTYTVKSTKSTGRIRSGALSTSIYLSFTQSTRVVLDLHIDFKKRDPRSPYTKAHDSLYIILIPRTPTIVVYICTI
jgi:hypothetical protein